MIKKAHELHFISQIKRDGSGVTKVNKNYSEAMQENPVFRNEDFDLHCLSITQKTYIAFDNVNAFIVRIKEEE